MTLADWIRTTTRRLSKHGFDGLDESVRDLRCGYLRRTRSEWAGGENIFDRDWDMLVVLDACRYDLFEEVADKYDLFAERGEFHSPGSCSGEWMRETFTEERSGQVAETVYVNGNPNGPDNLPRERFLAFEDVWSYAWDDDLGTVRPEPLTDRTVALAREHDPERIIVHYMQPHHPFVSEPVEADGGIATVSNTETVWDLLRRGRIDSDDVWRRYRDNLRYVLDRLDPLLSNVDAERTIITADHGNLVGEYGIYGHPVGVPVEELRRVPWVETTATDEDILQPDLEPPEEGDLGDDVQDRLEALGYAD